MEDLSGKQLGQYQVIAPLGQGGMATVYKAFQSSMERYVALKILPRHLATEPDFVERFRTEAKVIANLEHPNIVPVHDFGESDNYTYLVMRFIDGHPLSDLLQGQPLPCSQIQDLLGQIAAALDYAHSKGVVHRDIKPSNVMLDSQGNCLLSDFGLAKVLIGSSQLTASGAFIGTPTYASPEQCLGRADIDQRSDVYSLGVILYEMVTGRPPFDAETPMGVVIKHIHDPLPSPRSLNPDLSETVERVILKALSKESDGRYSTAGELLRAFNDACDQREASIPITSQGAVASVDEPQTDPTTDISQKSRAGFLGKLGIGACFGIVVLLLICGLGSLWVFNNLNLQTGTPTQNARVFFTIEATSTQTDTPQPPTSIATLLPKSTETLPASATHTPSITPSSTEAFATYSIISSQSVIVRSGPGKVYRWVEGSPYPKGTEFLIEGRSDDGAWFFVSLPDDLQGWAEIKDLQADLDMATLQIVEAPPTPVSPATDTPQPAQSKDKDKDNPTAVNAPSDTPKPTANKPPSETPYP